LASSFIISFSLALKIVWHWRRSCIANHLNGIWRMSIPICRHPNLRKWANLDRIRPNAWIPWDI